MLMIIQFVVINSGAGRVAEVAARFTLDAMPGKQMAIDADLNSGLIDENQARARRKAVETEADFYGAMDGASKFLSTLFLYCKPSSSCLSTLLAALSSVSYSEGCRSKMHFKPMCCLQLELGWPYRFHPC